jgi:hypothetical protein
MGSRVASERDRFWLKHHEAQGESGKDAKAYAASAGVSVQALYQARKRLRAQGLLAPGRARSMTRARFSKVTVPASPAIEEARFRITLPNGAVLEWSGAASVGPVGDLVERMARLP